MPMTRPRRDTADASRRSAAPGRHRHPRANTVLAVTTRPVVRLRLQAVSAALGLPAPVFAEHLEAVLESGADSPVLFLDLGSCCNGGELGYMAQTWAVFRPGSEIIAFTPLVDRETELRIVVDLLRSSHLIEVRVMTASDFYRDETWRNLLSLQERAVLESELRSELLRAVAMTGLPAPG